ncbi:MAG TPA: hypothetical protein VGO76_14640 [Luteibacter sp.]|jgi:hypothetical protein|nr:hypothetical protein [Luteibacter sp.]
MRGIPTLTGMFLSIVLCVANAASPIPAADTDGLAPWHFHMTPQEVMAFADYGPYRSFSNGDLETFTGLFDGKKENVQFFFRNGKLVRIGIYLYEGQDAREAADAWARTYVTLKAQFGEIELPGVRDESTDPTTMAAAAGAKVEANGKSQMAPVHQPADKFVFASFQRAAVRGQVFYYVTVNYDPPHG